MSRTLDDRTVAAARRHLIKADPKLGRVIKQVGPLDWNKPRVGSHFEALVSIILGQQLSGKAAQTIFNRVKDRVRERTLKPEGLARLTDNDLRECGVSQPKQRAIRSLLAALLDGSLNLRGLSRLDDERVYEKVTAVKGLGPWSAQVFTMFILRRADLFCPGDLGIQKAMAELYGQNGRPDELIAFAERWRPYRTVACWYLWAWLNHHKK